MEQGLCPDYDRAAEVFVRIALRMLDDERAIERGGPDADPGLLPGVDRGAG
jgi:hypothetical protein